MKMHKHSLKPSKNGFEGTKHSCPLLSKSVIADTDIKTNKREGAKANSVNYIFTLGPSWVR